MPYLDLPPIELELEGHCDPSSADGFFPEQGDMSVVAAAKRVCKGCPVKNLCLEWSIETEQEYGIWGGVGERTRRAIISKRRAERGQAIPA